MNKILIVLLIIGVGALGYLFLGQEPEGDDVLHNDEMAADIEAVEEYLQEDTSDSVFGSCNSIAEASTCVEYRGSLWGDNNMAALNCEGAGVYSNGKCPTGAYGGCQTSGGTTMEMVAWMYPQGGGEITPESVQYAEAACNANPVAQWILAD